MCSVGEREKRGSEKMRGWRSAQRRKRDGEGIMHVSSSIMHLCSHTWIETSPLSKHWKSIRARERWEDTRGWTWWASLVLGDDTEYWGAKRPESPAPNQSSFIFELRFVSQFAPPPPPPLAIRTRYSRKLVLCRSELSMDIDTYNMCMLVLVKLEGR